MTDFGDATIHTIDLGTNPPTVYGPFLKGQIIPQTQVGPVKVLPGSRFALLLGAFSNMYLLDIADPRNPFVALGHGLSAFMPGLAVSPDGRFAVIPAENLARFVSLPDLSLGGGCVPLGQLNQLTSAAIAPNNTTIVLSDSLNHRLVYGEIKPTLDCIDPIRTIDAVSAPTKVAFAPDGETLLAGGVAVNGEVRIYRLTSTGLVPGNPPRVEVGAQSFSFDPRGNLVYALSWGGTLSILRVEAPGQVSVEKLNAVQIPTYLDMSGIDMMGITPDGARLVVGDSLETICWIVKLSDLSVTSVNTSGKYPTAIAVFSDIAESASSIPMLSHLALAAFAVLLALVGAMRLAR